MSLISQAFPNIVRSSLINKYVNLIVNSHNDTYTDTSTLKAINEDIRRNQLHKFMVVNKKNYKLKGSLVTENSFYDPSYVTISRADIVYYPTQFVDKGIVFECKIIKKNVTQSVIKKAFYDEGLDRFKVKYPVDLNFCGIIIFCENGTHSNINSQVLNEISGKYIDRSDNFAKNYIYVYDYLDITDLYVLLLEN